MTGRHDVPAAQAPTTIPVNTPVVRPTVPAADFTNWLPRGLLVTNLLLLALLGQQLLHRPTYQYQTVSPSDYSFEEEMNKLGAAGWKTESCRRATSYSGSSASYECIMSRPKLGW